MLSRATFENQVLVKDLGIENRDVDLYLMKCKGMTADSITRSPMRCSVYRYAGALDKTAITTAYHIMAFESEVGNQRCVTLWLYFWKGVTHDIIDGILHFMPCLYPV